MWKKEIARRNTYVDKIFNDAKKPEATPGVGRYTPNAIDYIHPSEVSQKMSTGKRVSNIDTIFIRQKETPGPHSYQLDEALKEKVPGVYLGQNKAPQAGLQDENVFLGQQTPGAQYKADPQVQSGWKKSPSANMKRDMVLRSPKPVRDNSPSPNSYPEKDRHWGVLSQNHRLPTYSLRKEKQGSYLDVHVKKKKFVPGPGAYKTDNMLNFAKLARGPSPHFKRGR